MTVSTDRGVDKVLGQLEKGIESHDKLDLATTLDHAKNAESTDASLDPTTLVVFNDPHHETPVINKSRLAAIDFPLKILVWQDGGETHVAFNAPAYIEVRHAVEQAGLFLGPIEDNLVELVEKATGETVEDVHKAEQIRLDPFEGVIRKESKNSVSDTFDKLKSLIEDHDKLSVISTVDFTANAKSIDRELRLSKMILFGNPEAGTPLMQKSPTIGIDLPQKFLVYEGKRGTISVAYNNPFYLAERHELEGADEQLKAIKSVLDDVAAEGTDEIDP